MELTLKFCDNDKCATWSVTNQGMHWINVTLPQDGPDTWNLCSPPCVEVMVRLDHEARIASRQAGHKRWIERGDKEGGRDKTAPAAPGARKGKRDKR